MYGESYVTRREVTLCVSSINEPFQQIEAHTGIIKSTKQNTLCWFVEHGSPKRTDNPESEPLSAKTMDEKKEKRAPLSKSKAPWVNPAVSLSGSSVLSAALVARGS